MAAAAPEILSSALDDESGYEVSCEWCKEVEGFIVDPKKLPCGHVICANCLSSKIEDQTQTECIKCGTDVPTTTTGLPSALVKPTFCNTCTDKGVQGQTANVYCVQCDAKFCNKHREAHNDLHPRHDRLDIREYLKSARSRETRFCPTHKDEPLTLGCSNCLKIACVKCITAMDPCMKAQPHNLMSLDELIKPLSCSLGTLRDRATQRLSDLSRHVSQIEHRLGEWENHTKEGIEKIVKTETEHTEALRKEYQILKRKYYTNRQMTKDKIDHHLHSKAKPLLTQLTTQVNCKLSLDITTKHTVDIVKDKVETEEMLGVLSYEKFPGLVVDNQLTITISDARKWEADCNLIEAEDILFHSEMPRLSPPQSIQFVKSIDTEDVCKFISCNAIATYVALENGTIMWTVPELSLMSINLKEKLEPLKRYRTDILSIRTKTDDVYVLVDSKSKRGLILYRLSGVGRKHRTHGNKIAFVKNNTLAVIEKGFAGITLYSLDGEEIKTVRFETPAKNFITMKEFDDNSVVVVAEYPTRLIKLKISTETVEWTCDPTEFSCSPTAIHCNGNLVYILGRKTRGINNSYSNTTAANRFIFIINADSGEFLLDKELPNSSQNSWSSGEDLLVESNILMVPKGKSICVYHLIDESD